MSSYFCLVGWDNLSNHHFLYSYAKKLVLFSQTPEFANLTKSYEGMMDVLSKYYGKEFDLHEAFFAYNLIKFEVC